MRQNQNSLLYIVKWQKSITSQKLDVKVESMHITSQKWVVSEFVLFKYRTRQNP